MDNYEAILTSCETYIEKLMVGFYLIRKSLACLLRPPPPELSFFFFGLEDAIFLVVPVIIIIIIIITRSYAALRAADLDWIVGPGYSPGG